MIEKIKFYIHNHFNSFVGYIVNVLASLMVIYLMRRILRSFLSKENYLKIKTFFRYRILIISDGMLSGYDNSKSKLTDEDIKTFFNIVENFNFYDKEITITYFNRMCYNYFITFDEDKHYDGYDIGNYIIYKSFFNKKKYGKIIKREGLEMDIVVKKGEGEEVIHLTSIDYMCYPPVSIHKKRKAAINKML